MRGSSPFFSIGTWHAAVRPLYFFLPSVGIEAVAQHASPSSPFVISPTASQMDRVFGSDFFFSFLSSERYRLMRQISFPFSPFFFRAFHHGSTTVELVREIKSAFAFSFLDTSETFRRLSLFSPQRPLPPRTLSCGYKRAFPLPNRRAS